MKKVICLMLTALLLLGGVTAADESVGAETCQHVFELYTSILPEHEWIVRNADEAAFLASAVCIRCDESCIVVRDKALLTPEPCEPEVCTHRLATLPDFTREVYENGRNGAGDPVHHLVCYDVGVCLDCGLVATVMAGQENEVCRMIDKRGFHVEGQHIHVVCRECAVCGYMTGELVPCVAYEDGSCDTTLGK